MQALILAAGMGKRLGSMTRSRAKCMVPLNGKTLIERSLEKLAMLQLDRIVIVVGFEGNAIRTLLGDSYDGTPIVYIENREYATTNNIYSLYLALDELTQDSTLLLESDLIYDIAILERLTAHPARNVAVVDKYRNWMDGTVVTLSPTGAIQHFIPKKDFDPDRVDDYYKTVNIYKFSQEFAQNEYAPFLRAYVQSMGRSEYYEQVLRVLMVLERQDLVALPLNGEKWYEVDDVQDLVNAETVFAEPDNRYNAFAGRHGGYWRFPDLIDFCYLVNPYYPPPTMAGEMQRAFPELLAEYPSAGHVIDHLAARLYDVPQSQIVVGNGAAELISLLGQHWLGESVVVPRPTFEEYHKRFQHAEVMPFDWPSPDFQATADFLNDRVTDTDALVLVNPENPTGQCLVTSEVIRLCELLHGQGKLLILDESFVDFADPEHCCTLLDQETLARFPNLILVKSISKSYGVPGARLGVVATSNAGIVEMLRRARPVWNINSFGEFFLQVAYKYRDDYAEACTRLRTERTRFTDRLASLQGVKVFPSQANYLLLEIPDLDSRELAQQLVVDYNLLVKDLAGKPGIPPDGQFLRIAVRNQQDNDKLVEALEEVLVGAL